MAFDIFRLVGRVVLNSSEALTGLRNVENYATRTGEVFKKVGGGITSAGKAMTTFVTVPVLAGIAGAIKQASDMNETISKTEVVFKKGAKEVLAWSDQTLKSVGLAKGTSLDMAATFGDMGTAMGLTNKKSQEMAMNLVNLTGDMASFKNMNPEDIHLALAGAYTGETEALKSLGIVMTVANLERFAASKGIKKNIKDMSEAEKIQLRYDYIMKASKNSIGDFARTQDSAANQMRIFTEGLKEAGAKIGTILLPYFTKAITIVNKLMDRFHGLSPAMQKIVLIAALVVAGIGPLLIVIGTLITFIGGVVVAIGTIGAPVAAVIAAIIPFIMILTGLITTIGMAAYKTGILQKAFNFLKNIFNAVKMIIQGDFVGAWELLTKKMGFSEKKAANFIQKISEAKTAMSKAITVIKNVGKLIKAMFSSDKQKVINLLIKKFGLSKKEAIEFWKKVQKLKDEIVKFAKTLKNDGVKGLVKFADYIKKGAKFIIDHRKEIAKAIEKIISFATTLVRQAKRGYDAAKWLVKFATRVKSAMEGARNAVIKAIGKITSTVSGLRSKMWNAGYNAIKALGNGIASAFGYLRGKAKEAAGIIADFIGFKSPTKEGPGRLADKWGPNLITMLSKTILDKKGLLRTAMEKISGEMDLNSKINNIGISATGINGQQAIGKDRIILQLINPKFFNQDDVNKMMEPVIRRLDFLGYRSR